MKALEVVPYKDKQQGKKEQVADMFNSISGKYDFLNHLLSFGIDMLWRKKAIELLKRDAPKTILDIATGTGDFAIEALRLNPDKVVGVDISEGMLAVGREKMLRHGYEGVIDMQLGDSEQLSFDDNHFDAVIAAFGVRNFEHPERGLADMLRVLKPRGKAVILEFSRPKVFPFKQLYHVYFRAILPSIGRIVSRDKSAYTYLPESVHQFPEGQDFLHILNRIGFKETQCTSLTFGISSIYTGIK